MQGGKLVILSDQDVHVYGYSGWYMVDRNSFRVVSLHLWNILRTWLSLCLVTLSFFHGPSCVQHFFFLFFVCLDLHVSIFLLLYFFIAHVSFVTKDGERIHHIMWSFYFMGYKKWYNANFSWKHSKGVYGVHVNLDHESMKRILPRLTTIWQCSMQRQAANV